jgi:acetyl esterase/lipase
MAQDVCSPQSMTPVADLPAATSRRLVTCMLRAITWTVLLRGAAALPVAADSDSTDVADPLLERVDFKQVLALPARPADARYAYADHAEQFADLRLPRPAGGPVPVVVFLHGGCWLDAFGIDHADALAAALADEGFAVWSVEYRRVGHDGGGWPGSLQDILLGIEALARLGDPRLDLSRTVLTGHSAGGHLALLAGGTLAAHPVDGLRLRAVVGLAAIVDLTAYAGGSSDCAQAAVRFMGGPPDDLPEAYAEADPSRLPLHPTSRLIHGTEDRIVPAQQARDAAWPVDLVQGAGHFDLIHPGTPAWRRIVDVLHDAVR